MKIGALDYSISSPGLVVYEGNEHFSYEKCSFFFYSSLKKTMGHPKFQGTLAPDYECNQERYNNISEWALDKLMTCDHVYMEDYALGACGQVFGIAENAELIKYKLWINKLPLTVISPTSIKKFYFGKGTAKKEDMEKVFIEETGIDLKFELGQTTKQWSPSGDLIDAYAIARMGHGLFLETTPKVA